MSPNNETNNTLFSVHTLIAFIVGTITLFLLIVAFKYALIGLFDFLSLFTDKFNPSK